MAIMESSNIVSSRESLYSVESEEEDEEQRCGEGEVFLSDSGSDVEKEVGPLRHRQDTCPKRRNFLFSPRSGRTNPGLLFRGHKHQPPKPLGLIPSARLPPVDPCCHYPEKMFCNRLMDTDSNLPRQTASQKRTENGCRKRLSTVLGGGQPHVYTAQPPVHGKKRQRNEETEGREDSPTPCWTARDLLFAQKCCELQGFVRPLMELLNRLKTGRFDRALSSFQQSVAMDRIQRIIGVLQKPEMGERYLGTLLQVERMLKVWFPHIALKMSHTNSAAVAAEKTCETRKNFQDRRAVPDSVESPPTEELHQTHLTDPDFSDSETRTPLGEPGRFPGDWPAMNMTWIHTAPISNPPLGHMDFSQVNPTFGQAFPGPRAGSTYGLIVFLQNNAAVPGNVNPVMPLGSFHTSPVCFHSNIPAPGPSEHPRCQSLPGPTTVGSHLPRGTLGCLSKSLPNLPTSIMELNGQVSNGRPTCNCSS
ncbi:circadian-associated transcriptional repressor [Pogona vitticeps]